LVSVSSPVVYSRATDQGRRLFFDLVRFHSGAHRSGSRAGGSGAGKKPKAEALLVLAKLMLATRPHSP